MDHNRFINPAILEEGSAGTPLDQQFQPCGCADLLCGHGGLTAHNIFDDDARPFTRLDMPLPPQPSTPRVPYTTESWQNTQPSLRIQTATQPILPLHLQQIQDMAGTRDPLFDYVHNNDTFTPGFGFQNSVISPTNYPAYTPDTTVPSIAEEDQTLFDRIPCPDFLGKGRQQVQLQAGNNDCYYGATFLAGEIRNKGYRMKAFEGAGDNTALSALHMGMSSSMPSGMFPPPVGKMQLLLQNTKRDNNRPSDDSVTAASLFTVLKRCGDDLGVQFQMGVIWKGVEDDVYEVTMHGDARVWGGRTIWMFFDLTGSDTGFPKQWSAIIPSNLPSTTASWARVAAAPPPRPPTLQTPRQAAPDAGMLHPGYSPSATRPYHGPLTLRPYTGPRGRQGRTPRSINGVSSGAIPGRGRHSSRSSRASSVSGTFPTCERCSKTFETHTELLHHQRKYAEKSHICAHCGTGFLYPKDLRRHETRHSQCKQYKCPHCSKTYSRKDNMKRHVRNDHEEFTPPPSSVGASEPA